MTDVSIANDGCGAHIPVANKGQTARAPASVAELCEALQELGVRRRMCIKMQMGVQTRLSHLVGRMLGYSSADGKQETGLAERKAALVSALLKGSRPARDAHLFDDLAADGVMASRALAPIIEHRALIEKEMARLARDLPAYAFVKSVAGFGDKAFAVLIGEAGDLSPGTRYSAPEKLWKRMGLAPYKGKACSSWRKRDLTDEEWTEAGYNRARRAEAHACIAEPMAKHQLESAEKSGTPFGRPKGLYGEIYVRRRAHTLITHPDWPKAHARADALRVMTKAMLRDLWRAWRDEIEARG